MYIQSLIVTGHFLSPPGKKGALLQPQPRERPAGPLIKSAWCALTRPQAATMEFSPVEAARCSSREQWKVQNMTTSCLYGYMSGLETRNSYFPPLALDARTEEKKKHLYGEVARQLRLKHPFD